MPSKNMGSPFTIVKPSPELKNSSRNLQKGLWCEEVTQEHFQQQGWKLLYQRKKLPFGEVDLVFTKTKEILLVEVKSLHNEWMAFERIKARQVNKLLHNLLYLQFHPNNKTKQILACICFVAPDKKIELIYV